MAEHAADNGEVDGSNPSGPSAVAGRLDATSAARPRWEANMTDAAILAASGIRLAMRWMGLAILVLAILAWFFAWVRDKLT